jgi:aryl-alcohol dehydrogenase-like predicted oxidoreductase
MLEMKPDIVQIPYNLLDRKFDSYLPELNSYGTEIHIRSVYLQGLFFMDAQYLPVKLQPLKSALIEIKRISIENNLTIAQLLLSFVNYNQYVNKIVIGVASSKQLLDNVRDISTGPLNKNLLEEIRLLKVTDAELLNPFNWK